MGQAFVRSSIAEHAGSVFGGCLPLLVLLAGRTSRELSGYGPPEHALGVEAQEKRWQEGNGAVETAQVSQKHEQSVRGSLMGVSLVRQLDLKLGRGQDCS